MKSIRKAIIPVAGFGTRLLPISKAIPKEMVPVVDRPLIQHVVEEAVAAGINEIILVTRTGKNAIEDHFDAHFELEESLAKKEKKSLLKVITDITPPDLKITSVRQAEAKGLGHAICCASHLLGEGEPFAVILPDVLVKPQPNSNVCDLHQMVKMWNTTKEPQIMVEAVPYEEVYRYGIVDCIEPSVAESSNIRRVVEKPKIEDAPSRLSIIGRYILPYRIMELLQDQPPGAGDEIQLTDAIDRLIKEQGIIQAYRMQGRTFDCGHIDGWLKANTTLAREAGFEI